MCIYVYVYECLCTGVFSCVYVCVLEVSQRTAKQESLCLFMIMVTLLPELVFY